MYSAEFKGWGNLTIEDMFVAYRKAKADCFFENTFPTAIKFADYEQDLLGNLSKLLDEVEESQGFCNNVKLLGEIRLLPKKLSINPDSSTAGHIHFSDAKRAFENLVTFNTISPEFRLVGDFPVDAHVLSALWINMIGHKFDACLSESCYGARLRRIVNDEILEQEEYEPFHLRAIGSFAPYFEPYQKWRGDGLKAIRGELDKEKHIIAASLDLKSYYHYIEPLDFSNMELFSALGVDLSEEEITFTRELANFLNEWNKKAAQFSKDLINNSAQSDVGGIKGGLAIGLTASRIISNVLLHKWDKLIVQNVSPIHYGRYVDDMFLVLRDPGNIRNTDDFMRFLQTKIGEDVVYQDKIEADGSSTKWNINQGKDVQEKSMITLQSDKQKLFILDGQAGLDLLDSIEKDIYELSSEHRLMPSPDQLEHSTAARVLSAAGSVGEKADTLRRADGLTIQRLSWALQLRHVETLALDLPSTEWSEQRKEFYQFAHTHVLRADNLFSHFSYLPRLLGFAISLNEWDEAERIVSRSYASLKQLQEGISDGNTISINGFSVEGDGEIWRYIKATITWMFIDAAARYYDPDKLKAESRSKKEQRLSELFLKGILGGLSEFSDIFKFGFGVEEFFNKAPLIALADLARTPYKRVIVSKSVNKLIGKTRSKKEGQVLKKFESAELIDVDDLKGFLNSSKVLRLASLDKNKWSGESYLPYLFPTRPLTPLEIAELAPECVGLLKADGKQSNEKPSHDWAKYTQAIRGVWVKPSLLAQEQEQDRKSKRDISRFMYIGTERKKKVIVALTNIKTDDSDWAKAACNKSNLAFERYCRISDLVNQTIRLRPRPDYMLFPELSLPLPWVQSVSDRLLAAGISLIAGTEYRHLPKDQLYSEACLVLTDNRLGFRSSVKIWQPKLQPAVGEDKELTSKYGKEWANNHLKSKKKKPVYVHNGMHFGVMVCSELQNSKARVEFQGDVDALMILSWNQDLDTFSSLIEASALDIHAYTILVNNRKYGDSRVRSPAKESFLRDIARVRGGDNDFVVAATIDIESLRAFQSRSKRWPDKGDPFKPVPEGYIIHKGRKSTPPR